MIYEVIFSPKSYKQIEFEEKSKIFIVVKWNKRETGSTARYLNGGFTLAKSCTPT